MIIAVNTRYFPGEDPDGRGDFIFECFSRLASTYPQHRFIYIFDRPFDKKLITSKNIIPVVTGPKATTPLRWQYWYNYKVPAVLRKYDANVFVSMDGICSLRTKTPQCLLAHDPIFLQIPGFMAKSHLRFHKKFMPRFLEKAKSILTLSPSSKVAVIDAYKVDPAKIDVVYKSADTIFCPIGQQEKERTKSKYSGGKEYFLFSGPVRPASNLLNLLKAFSFFKKRQKSNMQLVIAAGYGADDAQFLNDLKNFKFKNEVALLGDLSKNELSKITAAAYGFVYPVLIEDLSAPCLEAMQCEVPVITSSAAGQQGIYGDAAIYVRPDNFRDIAEKMMTLFKDEKKRSELISKGKTWARQYDWHKTTDQLWKSVSLACKSETT